MWQNGGMTITHACPLKQLSRGRGPAVHRYYDVPVESPSGERILYFEFDSDAVPGPGMVIVADRDGGDIVEVGRAELGIGHVGASAAWVDDETVAYCPTLEPTVTRIVAWRTGKVLTEFAGSVRAFQPGTGVGIVVPEAGTQRADRHLAMQSLQRWSFADNTFEDLLTIDEAAAVHPRCKPGDAARMNFMNQKWSPDGSKLFTVFTDEVYRKGRDPAALPAKIKAILVMEPDGSDLRYVGEFTHHPMWTSDGNAIIVHQQQGDRQDLVKLHLDGREPTVLVRNHVGVHTALDRDGHFAFSDAFPHPSVGKAAILRYDLEAGTRSTLAVGAHENTDHQTGSHPHPILAHKQDRLYFNFAATGRPQLYALDLTALAAADA